MSCLRRIPILLLALVPIAPLRAEPDATLQTPIREIQDSGLTDHLAELSPTALQGKQASSTSAQTLDTFERKERLKLVNQILGGVFVVTVVALIGVIRHYARRSNKPVRRRRRRHSSSFRRTADV